MTLYGRRYEPDPIKRHRSYFELFRILALVVLVVVFFAALMVIQQSKCSIQVPGTMISGVTYERRHRKRRYSTTYTRGTVRYIVNGVEYLHTFDVRGNKTDLIGMIFEVLYDPANPSHCFVVGLETNVAVALNILNICIACFVGVSLLSVFHFRRWRKLVEAQGPPEKDAA